MRSRNASATLRRAELVFSDRIISELGDLHDVVERIRANGKAGFAICTDAHKCVIIIGVQCESFVL